MTTYPPVPLPYQLNQLLANESSALSYKGYEGTIFHLTGPQAPVLGAQTGVSITDIAGIDAPFRHLDNKGARQDGTTWYDTLYDPAEIKFTAELSGMSPSDMRRIIGSWWGAWDPAKLGKLCWFSPERGEWWANVRMAKNVQTQYKQDWYHSGRVQFNWIARNDDSFWQSVDSVYEYGNDDSVVSDGINRVDGIDLGPNWMQTYTGNGICATPSGTAISWTPSGGADGSVVNQYSGNGSESSNGQSGNDHQTVSVTLASDMPSSGNSYIDLWARMDSAFSNQYGIRARFGYNSASLSILHAGTLTQVWSGPTTMPVLSGQTLSLQCGVTQPGILGNLESLLTGTNRNPNQFQLYQNGVPIIMATGTGIIGLILADIENFFGLGFGWTDSANLSSRGAGFRGWGFGMAAAGTGTTQIPPASISSWSGGSDTGFITLTNMGDQPAWPRYLCYGPGTFVIGDAATNTMVNFGPLLPGQVALLTTLPRLQGVQDVTPSTATVGTQTPDGVQTLIEGIINFVTNNNVPPLLQQFESIFGILPPQGPMYSLLNGRFTTPIAPMVEQVGPNTVQIPVQIQGGNDQSKVIAAVTPMRRWPE